MSPDSALAALQESLHEPPEIAEASHVNQFAR